MDRVVPSGSDDIGAKDFMSAKMKEKPKVKLIDNDGNAFSILGTCQKAARRAGWTEEEIRKFMHEATSGDYPNLLSVCMEYFEVD